MRPAIFGDEIDDLPLVRNMVRALSRLWHTDPKGEFGAISVALAAKTSRDHKLVDVTVCLMQVTDAVGKDGAELIDLLRRVTTSIEIEQSTLAFAESLGKAKGVTG